MTNVIARGSRAIISDVKSPFVTVVVINYNGGHYVLKCLQNLLQTEYTNYRVAVLDNASIDSSIDDIHEKFPQIKVIRLDTNVGYAGGAYFALNLFQDEYIVILNNDVYVDHEWLHKLMETAEANPEAIMIGPRMLNPNDDLTSFAWACITFPVIGSMIRANGHEYSGLVRSSYVAGSLFLIRRNEALSIGSFDMDYFLNWEEIDFSWRAWLCGYRVLINLDACVHHEGGKSIKGTFTIRRMSFYSNRNRMMTYHKYLCNRLLLISLLGEITFGSLLVLRSISSNDLESHLRLQGYLLAIIWIIKNLKVVYRKRLDMKKICKFWGLLPPYTVNKIHLIDISRHMLK